MEGGGDGCACGASATGHFLDAAGAPAAAAGSPTESAWEKGTCVSVWLCGMAWRGVACARVRVAPCPTRTARSEGP